MRGLVCAAAIVAASVSCFVSPTNWSSGVASAADPPREYLKKHCYACHDAETREGNLDLSSLAWELENSDHFARWVKVHDRVAAGEMPPRTNLRKTQSDPDRPPAAETTAMLASLSESLISAEQRRGESGRTGLRRLTRGEYENTLRDLFDMPGIALQGNLPTDGSAFGFDKNSEALDLSHVNMAKYVEAADHALELAIATQPEAPTPRTRRISLANNGGFVAHVLMNGDGVLLKDKKPDPAFPPAGEFNHIDEGAHARLGLFSNKSTVGLFRHEDESLSPYFIEHVTIYPGRYRVRTSLWSFTWDKGQVLPGRGTEAARLSVVQLTGDGRGGQHPSYVLGYFDAPSMDSQTHELITWLNHNELIGFNTASLAPVANYARKGRAMAFTGPGIAVDWLEVEGPLHDSWPPASHRVLFGDLPLVEFKASEQPKVKPPARKQVRQLGAGLNRPDPSRGLWTVASSDPARDADRLLGEFLGKAFRRPVSAETRRSYVERVEQRLQEGDSFEVAMRWAFRAALCSPDFLYHVERVEGERSGEAGEASARPLAKAGQLIDQHSLAARLSYFLWNSGPDATLRRLADEGRLRDLATLRGEVERLLKDPRSKRFVDDFLGQWLKLRQIAATDPDRKLYPEFSPYLQDSMVAETRAYFRELLDRDLDATHLVRSKFAMLNEKLATHYGIPGVKGSQVRRVDLPENHPRGPFLTQASLLKITANGTTTSPVPRGAFVMARLLGEEPDPPPPNVPAIEPDVRGAKTIREQLDKHRTDAVCASCHRKMDPPGFALESFDVIGGWRNRYRSIGEGDPAPRGTIDPFIGIGFKLGPPVDSSGILPDERAFKDVVELQQHLAEHPRRLLKNVTRQLAVYSSGRDIGFSERPELERIVDRVSERGGGVRSLIHELVQSPLFQTK